MFTLGHRKCFLKDTVPGDFILSGNILGVVQHKHADTKQVKVKQVGVMYQNESKFSVFDEPTYLWGGDLDVIRLSVKKVLLTPSSPRRK